MTTIRAILTIAAGGAFGCAVAFLILGLGHTAAGVALAFMAALLVVRELVAYLSRPRVFGRWSH